MSPPTPFFSRAASHSAWDRNLLALTAIAGLLLLNGCHLGAVGGSSGALIGGAVAGRRGAMIGGGAGMLAGVAAERMLEAEDHSLYGSCDSFRTYDERQACRMGRVRAEEQNRRERIYRAERYGYEKYRHRTRW